MNQMMQARAGIILSNAMCVPKKFAISHRIQISIKQMAVL